MNAHIFQLPWQDFARAFGMGAGLGLVYMYLLWKTVQTLPRVKHKGLFLFLSAVLRIFLLIFGAIVLSQDHVGKFLIIICGVWTMRLIVLRFTKIEKYREIEEKEMAKAIQKKTAPKGKRRK